MHTCTQILECFNGIERHVCMSVVFSVKGSIGVTVRKSLYQIEEVYNIYFIYNMWYVAIQTTQHKQCAAIALFFRFSIAHVIPQTTNSVKYGDVCAHLCRPRLPLQNSNTHTECCAACCLPKTDTHNTNVVTKHLPHKHTSHQEQ